LDKLKKEKLSDKLLKVACKETILYLILAGLTLTVAYQMIDVLAFRYQKSLKNIFGAGDKSTSFFNVNTFMI
jgi:hypothetical protein